MRLQKISIFYLVAFFALLSSIGNILSGENSLDLYDSKARFYDSMIGRTTSQDPLAEKYYHLSPYLWCAANPIKFGDDSYSHTEWGILSNGQTIPHLPNHATTPDSSSPLHLPLHIVRATIRLTVRPCSPSQARRSDSVIASSSA